MERAKATTDPWVPMVICQVGGEKSEQRKKETGAGCNGWVELKQGVCAHQYLSSLGASDTQTKKGKLQKRLQGGKEPDSPMNNNCESRIPEKKPIMLNKVIIFGEWQREPICREVGSLSVWTLWGDVTPDQHQIPFPEIRGR